MRRALRASSRSWTAILTALTVGAALVAGCGSGRPAARARHRTAGPPIARPATHWRWIASWAASPEAPAPGSAFARGFRDQTIRNIIYTSTGGSMVRVRLENSFGSRPLAIGRAAIGVAGRGAAVTPATRHLLTFAGRDSAVIAPGRQLLSDPVRLAVRPLERLAVSVFVPRATGSPTQHTDAHQTNYLASGDHALAGDAAAFTPRLGSWYFVSALDVRTSGPAVGSIVALGDSITNGNGSLTGANRRWPNDLARRLDAVAGPTLSIVDAGIEGNRVLNPSPFGGRSALARFGPDVLHQAGVRAVIVLEGINDIGFASSTGPLTAPHTDVSAQQIISGYEQLIARAHAAGLRIFGATLTPFRGAQHWSAAGESKREAINMWIRTSGAYDGVIDFASAVADPADPERLNPRYDDGDHLHLDNAGYQAMARAVNLAILLAAVRPAAA